jgi:hypothetical protein
VSLDDIHLFDPFSPADDLSLLVDPPEQYTVRKYQFLGASWFGIQLLSPPAYKLLPSSVTSETRRTLIRRTADPAFIYSEVSFSTSPSSNQYRVDYNNINPADGTIISFMETTGLVQFNPTEVGRVVDVYYWKTGPGLLPQNLATLLTDQTVPGNFNVSGNLVVGGTGVVKDTGDQTVAGVKTFTDTPVGTPLSRQAVFTTSGTWNVPAGVSLAYGKVIGGGAGGAGGGNFSAGGGGGGGGGVAEGFFNPSALEAVTVTIGSGGAGGASNTAGSDGSGSSIGSYLVAGGGSGGVTYLFPGGSSGVGTTGTILYGIGSGGKTSSGSGGPGGSGGGGATGGAADDGSSGIGEDAFSYGGGGGGGGDSGGGTGAAGGAGKSGIAIIWY